MESIGELEKATERRELGVDRQGSDRLLVTTFFGAVLFLYSIIGYVVYLAASAAVT